MSRSWGGAMQILAWCARVCACACVCACVCTRGNEWICEQVGLTLPAVKVRTGCRIRGLSAKWDGEAPCWELWRISRWWQQRMKPGVGPPKHRVPVTAQIRRPRSRPWSLSFQLVSGAGGASPSASYFAKSPWQAVENWAGNTFQNVCF